MEISYPPLVAGETSELNHSYSSPSQFLDRMGLCKQFFRITSLFMIPTMVDFPLSDDLPEDRQIGINKKQPASRFGYGLVQLTLKSVLPFLISPLRIACGPVILNEVESFLDSIFSSKYQ